MENSVWNDDQKTWILPNLINSIRLPPANLRSAFPKPKIKSIEDNNNNAQYRKVTSTDSSDSDVILYIIILVYTIDKTTCFYILPIFFLAR